MGFPVVVGLRNTALRLLPPTSLARSLAHIPDWSALPAIPAASAAATRDPQPARRQRCQSTRTDMRGLQTSNAIRLPGPNQAAAGRLAPGPNNACMDTVNV